MDFYQSQETEPLFTQDLPVEQHYGSCPATSLTTATLKHTHIQPFYQSQYLPPKLVYLPSQFPASSSACYTGIERVIDVQHDGEMSIDYNAIKTRSHPMISTADQPGHPFAPEPQNFERQLSHGFAMPHPTFVNPFKPIEPMLNRPAFTCQRSPAAPHNNLCDHVVPGWTNEQGAPLSPIPVNRPINDFSAFGSTSPPIPSNSQFHPISSSPTQPTMQVDSRPPSNSRKRYICEECSQTKKDSKSLKRHLNEVHRKPVRGQDQLEWFTCACGYQAHYSRRSNYTRHVELCRPEKWVHEFVCQCLCRHTKKDDHDKHYRTCKKGQGHVGRPRRGRGQLAARVT